MYCIILVSHVDDSPKYSHDCQASNEWIAMYSLTRPSGWVEDIFLGSQDLLCIITNCSWKVLTCHGVFPGGAFAEWVSNGEKS